MHRAFAAHAALDPSAADSVSRARLEQSESSSHTLSRISRRAENRAFNFTVGNIYTTYKNGCYGKYVLLIYLESKSTTLMAEGCH